MSLKEKLGVVLNQNGLFKCPNGPPKPKKAAALPDGAYERVLSDLQKRGASRPRTVKTLTATIHSLFQKGLTPAQLDTLIAKLQASGVIKVEGTKVAYELSGHT